MLVEVIKPEYLDEVYYVCFLCLYLCKMVEYTETWNWYLFLFK